MSIIYKYFYSLDPDPVHSVTEDAIEVDSDSGCEDEDTREKRKRKRAGFHSAAAVSSEDESGEDDVEEVVSLPRPGFRMSSSERDRALAALEAEEAAEAAAAGAGGTFMQRAIAKHSHTSGGTAGFVKASAMPLGSPTPPQPRLASVIPKKPRDAVSVSTPSDASPVQGINKRRNVTLLAPAAVSSCGRSGAELDDVMRVRFMSEAGSLTPTLHILEHHPSTSKDIVHMRYEAVYR